MVVIHFFSLFYIVNQLLMLMFFLLCKGILPEMLLPNIKDALHKTALVFHCFSVFNKVFNKNRKIKQWAMCAVSSWRPRLVAKFKLVV